MGRLFFIGDVHGSIELKKLSNKNFPLARDLTKDDVVCICGDAGFMWDTSNETKYWDDWAEDRPFTIVTCFGNHENYNAIRTLPQEIWSGGIVRKVRPHVMYLENGEFFDIGLRRIFVQGGASSIDKVYRKEGKSWWQQEIPSYEEFSHAAEMLEAIHFTTNIIVSHTAPNSMINKIDKFMPHYDDVTNFLEKYVMSQVYYDHWFCGHFHIDRSIPENNFHFLYNDIVEVLPHRGFNIVNG